MSDTVSAALELSILTVGGGASLTTYVREGIQELGGLAHVTHVSWGDAVGKVERKRYDAAVIDHGGGRCTGTCIDLACLLSSRYGVPSLIATERAEAPRAYAESWGLPTGVRVAAPQAGLSLTHSLLALVSHAHRRTRVAIEGLRERQRATCFVRGRGRSLYRLDLDEVAYLKADGPYTDVLLRGGRRHSLATGLAASLQQIGRDDFLRVHRGYAAAFDAIQSVTRDAVVLHGGESLPVGRTYRPALTAALLGSRGALA